MIIESIEQIQSSESKSVMDCDVMEGYIQGDSGSLPDIDVDFESTRRQEVKEYLETRYNHSGKQRVFSAGTNTTLKIKAVIKDVARTYRVPVNIVNYITAIFDDDSMDWTDLFKLAYTNKKVARFINDYPQIIEDIRGLMGQPRSASIHPSAIIVTPDEIDGVDVECFDVTPIKKVDGLLVSELDGNSIDESGLLKNDCLGIKELAKLKAIFNACNEVYGLNLSLESIVNSDLSDENAYRILSAGYTQNIFQFGSHGMTKFLMDMKPTCINDLIAENALYRPATLESGSTDKYVDCKNGDMAPIYLWGTYNSLKDTYGLLTYQEQLAQMAREIGGFSLGEGVNLVKLISKKKADKIHKMKDKFMEGAAIKGCPKEDAGFIWTMIESGASYLFNKCISGKETIYRPHGGKWCPTIAEMYKIMNDYQYAKETGHLPLREKYRKNGYGISLSLNHELKLVKNSIKDIRYMGVRPIYRITIEDGKTIDVTDNHKHPTRRGELRTDQLKVGLDHMFINSSHMKQDTSYRYTDFKLVVSIDYIGDDEVYDVEMCNPNHTFTTKNGIVTCNSHATAYAVTSYVGAYLKANYATAFYTVALEWADDKDIPVLMSEMNQLSVAKIVKPDINVSRSSFFTDYSTDSIFWSLTRIKMVGVKTVDYIIGERERGGEFTSIENFIYRIFKYKLKEYEFWDDPDDPDEAERVPVNARHVRNLIIAGCFDGIEKVGSVIERYWIVKRAAEALGFAITEKDFPSDLIDKHYFWSMQQVSVSGIGFIDYKRIYDNSDAKAQIKGKAKYMNISEISDLDNEGKKAAICASVVEIEEKKYKDKKTGEDKTFCKIKLQQNNDAIEMVMWDDFYTPNKLIVSGMKDKVIIVTAVIKYSDYAGCNNLNTINSSLLFQV